MQPLILFSIKFLRHGKIFEGFDDVFVKIELDDTHDFLLSFQNCEAYDDSISSRPTWPLINDGFAEGAQILQNYGKQLIIFHEIKNFRQFDLIQLQGFCLPGFQPERSA